MALCRGGCPAGWNRLLFLYQSGASEFRLHLPRRAGSSARTFGISGRAAVVAERDGASRREILLGVSAGCSAGKHSGRAPAKNGPDSQLARARAGRGAGGELRFLFLSLVACEGNISRPESASLVVSHLRHLELV